MPGVARDGDRRVWIALALVYLLWGSTYLGIRVMVETLPPLLGSAVRFLVAGVLLAAWTALRRGSPVGPGRREAGGTLLLGLLLVAGGPGLTAVAERDVPSGLAALVVATVPLWVVLLRRLGGERPAPAALLGVVLGFAGVALVVLPGGTGAAGALGLVLLVVVALSFATGSVLAPPGPGSPGRARAHGRPAPGGRGGVRGGGARPGRA